MVIGFNTRRALKDSWSGCDGVMSPGLTVPMGTQLTPSHAEFPLERA